MHNEQIYTPLNLVNFILDEVGFNCQNNIENKHIIDNSCGNGNFLVEIVRRIFDNVEKVDKAYLESYVHGIEIDNNVSDESRERLNQLALSYGVTDVGWDIRGGCIGANRL